MYIPNIYVLLCMYLYIYIHYTWKNDRFSHKIKGRTRPWWWIYILLAHKMIDNNIILYYSNIIDRRRSIINQFPI
jgi:hypothetical protein